jgi:DMSO reductase family type II enzyme chaperone
MYRLLAGAFAFPDESFHRAVLDGGFLSEVLAIAAGLPYELPLADGEPLRADLADAAADYLGFQSEYIRLFDVGVPRPPCALYGGLYLGSRRAVMEEVTRFYHHFGLSLGGESREMPDHLTTELEFMHFLTFREVAALEAGQDRGPCVRAERDFLQRHLTRWLPRVRSLAEKQKAAPFFLGVLALTEVFLLKDLAHVTALAGSDPRGAEEGGQ